jgi:DNA mismatch repair protein MSH5
MGMDNSAKSIAITGPNSSGKTILIVQVALIVFMAHIGSFVPCSEASLCIIDKILTRVRTNFSISLNESSFMTDLKNAFITTEQATSKSLVLLDEFGKGTVPSDGMGLFAAMLKTLVERNCFLLATTHFHELFNDQVILPLLGSIKFYILAIHIDEDEDIQFLYQLKAGKCEDSLGIVCAERAGCPEQIISRSREIKLAYNSKQPIPQLRGKENYMNAVYEFFDYFCNVSIEADTIDLNTEIWGRLRKLERLKMI